ncbi:MAG: methionyl-tRNA formyltransferase [Acidobacteriota bacterium]
MANGDGVAGSGLRLVLFGTPAFAVPTLDRLLTSPHAVVGVVTQPDRPRGRGHRVSVAPVKALALERGLPILQPERLSRDAFENPFSSLGADLGVVAAYGKILPEWLLRAPRLGMINVHASLLPRYRGAAPVHRAVVAGETTTGVTIMRVVKALDAGPMLGRVVRHIGADETSEIVEQALADLGAALLVSLLDDFIAGRIAEEPQEESEATYAPRLTKEEGRLDFSRPAQAIHNQVRGLQPWPSAYTALEGKRIVIHRTRLSDRGTHGVLPGTCLVDAARLLVACEDETIEIVEIQPEGRRVMTAREFLAGHHGLAGQRFG